MHRLQRIDELFLPAHQYLNTEDECYFLMSYTRLDFGHTSENDLILNFKKGMDRKGKAEWKWKGWAIGRIADMFIQNFPQNDDNGIVLVPVPPSKVKSDPMYDDRMVQVLNIFCNNHPYAEVREILSINANMTPSHAIRASPNEIQPLLILNKALCKDQPQTIILADDVITTGAHFRACKTILQTEFPNSTIKGLFIARAVR